MNRRNTLLVLCTATIVAVHAQTFSTLASFTSTSGPPGAHARLIQGADGSFYGTSNSGGVSSAGTIFKFTPGGALTTLYDFANAPHGISTPDGGLIQTSDGNLYGTTSPVDTVFKITPAGALSVLYTFGTGRTDPDQPRGALLQASDGNFYGTTIGGGTGNLGTLFKVTPSGAETTLYSFCSQPACSDGSQPNGELIQASDGNLYGTTLTGGTGKLGTVFKVTPGGALTTLYTFGTTPTDGSDPEGGLVQASDGNLYGTTSGTANDQLGTVFRITPGGVLTTLHNFGSTSSDGKSPRAGVIQAADGSLYGTTYQGGTHGLGTIFKVTPSGTVSIIYNFATASTDGGDPLGLVQGTDGNLYGITYAGGTSGNGTIFRIQLPAAASYTCTNTVSPVITSIDSASAYGGYSYFGSGSWLEIKGTNLADPADPRLTAATNPGQWTTKDFNGVNAPVALDGISVSINGKAAYVWYLSSGQLNVQAPEDTTTGNVAVTVTNCKATSPAFTFARKALAPGFLAPSNYVANGTQYMVATFVSDGAYVLNTSTGASFGLNSRPAKPGDLIVAYGVGFGDVTPSILPGVIVGQTNSLVNQISLSFGSTPATLAYSGLAGNFVGLYEFYVTVPQLADGDYQINVAQNGTTVPQTMYLTVHN